ncbi:MAG TPA: FAD/NAD(P)-binding oxidoreductase [Solirubrobacteraceae bacterium]|nr:FAD/NAD(P)-binding oxidoreductase [Solirubrobacteraceae bacterium]
MPPEIVILGAGTGGTLVANRLRRKLGDQARITVIDRDDEHVYQPGLLFVPFGMAEPADIVRSRRAQLHGGIGFELAEVDRVETATDTVHLSDGRTIGYDVLVIATGAVLARDETEGLDDQEWGRSIHTFYDLDGATELRDALAGFESGRLVVNVIDMPIKCPVAPLEFCFMADWKLRERGVRDEVEIVFVTPFDGAFTKPVASERLGGLLAERGVEIETEFATGRVEGDRRRLVSWDERELPYDLLVTIPAHSGASYVGRSPRLGDELNFVPADRNTLRSKAAENVFVIGDAADVPTSKAGSVTHFEGETVAENVERTLAGKPLTGFYDGHANCFVETGFRRALLIDFDYDTEPLPGRYPEPHLGPLPLLEPSRLNHLAKLAFQPLYWHVLLPGYDIPGVSSEFRGVEAAPATAGRPFADPTTPDPTTTRSKATR